MKAKSVNRLAVASGGLLIICVLIGVALAIAGHKVAGLFTIIVPTYSVQKLWNRDKG